MLHALTGRTTCDEVLFTELHHRFYNSLQVISSMAGGLTRADLTEAARACLADRLQRRVAVLGDLHRLLVRAHGSDLAGSCRELCEALSAAFDRGDVRIAVAVNAPPACPDVARGLMLLLAELVTNAMKHAPSGAALRIDVDLRGYGRDYELTVASPADGAARGYAAPRVASDLARSLGGALRHEAGRRYVVTAFVPSG